MISFAKKLFHFLPKLSLLLSDFGNSIAMYNCTMYIVEKNCTTILRISPLLQFCHPNNQILYLSEPGLNPATVCREPLLLTSMRAMHKKAWLVDTY